jgi:hypothetical protein
MQTERTRTTPGINWPAQPLRKIMQAYLEVQMQDRTKNMVKLIPPHGFHEPSWGLAAYPHNGTPADL